MRIEGWEIRLNDYILECANTEFKWGELDCLIFSSDTALICTGKDPMSYKVEGDPDTIRGQYTCEREAAVLIKKLRGSVENIMDVHFTRVKNPAFAQRGDIVMVELDEGKTFGVAWLGGALFKTKTGYVRKTLKECLIAWRVE